MKFFLMALALVSLVSGARADEVQNCDPAAQATEFDQFMFARYCQTQRTEGFSTRWLAAESMTELTLPNPENEYRYVGFWTSESAVEPALERYRTAAQRRNTIERNEERKAKRDAGDQDEIDALASAQRDVDRTIQAVLDLRGRKQVTERLDADGNAVFEIETPEGSGSPWRDHHLTLLAFDDNDTLVFASRVTARVVSGWVAVFTAFVFGAIMFFFIFRGLMTIHKDEDQEPYRRRYFGGQDRRMSLANVQIAWFSAIVLITMSYVVARSGELGELSSDVLLLLGIAAIGSTASKVGDNFSHRLERENYLFLRKIDWLPERPDYKISQLITDPAGRTDISRVQAVGFSFVVGMYLLGTGLAGLSDVNLPDGILALLGLSQATYVGMKATGAPLFGSLDTHLNKVRETMKGYTLEESRIIAGDGEIGPLYNNWHQDKKDAYDQNKDDIKSDIEEMKILFKDVYGIDPP